MQLSYLFSILIWNSDVAVTPDKKLAEIVLRREADNGNSEFGQQQDISAECMDNIFELLEIGLKTDGENGKELLKRLFYGKTKQRIEKLGDEIVRFKEEEFNHLIVGISEDLYSGLDEFFESSKVDFEQTQAQRSLTLIEPLPKILTIQIQRVKYSREEQRVYKSHDFVSFDKTLYIDRYMDTQEEAVILKRQIKNEIKMKMDRLSKEIVEFGDVDPNGNLAEMIVALELVAAQQDSPDRTETMQVLSAGIESLKTIILEKTLELQYLKNKLTLLYEDMKSIPYNLHAVFFHQGEAEFGHYWSCMWDEEGKRWLKYNDSAITEVQEKEIFEDTTGKMHSVYCLMYCEQKTQHEVLNTFARDEIVRQWYENEMPWVKSKAEVKLSSDDVSGISLEGNLVTVEMEVED
ncbi:ubiquitin-specific protease ubp2 [Nowakowskiella sp. JEL0078]|nr:ubiquitin-specific protease ubp2 [Nowakowskiella sp. JEL0078]